MTDPDCLILATEVGVLRALELAGKRAIYAGSRSRRGGGVDQTPAWEIHTCRHLATSHAQCDRLLAGVWELLATVLPDQPRIITAADWYARELIVTQKPYRRADLRRVLGVACEA